MVDVVAVKDKIDTEMKQYILNTQDVEQALVDIGIDIENKETWEYGDLIRSKKPELDKVPVLEGEVEELTTQNNGLIASNEELQTENENLTSQNTELITQVNDLTNSNNELTDQIETLTEQSAENVEIIDDAILAVQEKGGTVEDKSQLGNSIRALSGVVLNNLDYFFYKDCRSVDGLWADLVNGNVNSMKYMLSNANLTGGKTYLLDLSSCLTQDAVNYIFENTVAKGGDVNVQFRLGANNTTLYAMMYNKLVNTYGWNISFTDDTDCSGLTNMLATFRQNNITSIDLSKLVDAPLTDVSYMFAQSNIDKDKVIFPVRTFSNINMAYMCYKCTSMIESPVLDIVDTTEQVINYAYQYMFSDCTKLTKINYTNPWVLGSNTTSMCEGCSKLESVPPITFLCMSGGNRNSISSIYNGCTVLPEVEIYITYVDGTALYVSNSFNGCKALTKIKGNLDLSNVASKDHLGTIFKNCLLLEYFETTGSIAGLNNFSSATLDVSASPVFNIQKQLEMLASNDSGYTRIIKLNSAVYNALTDETLVLATEKNYTLASA